MCKINHFDYITREMELSIRKIQKGGKRFMAVNDFIVNLVAGLSKTKSKQQIKSDAKSLGDMYVKLIGNLDMPKTRKAIKSQLKGLNNMTFNITPNVNTKGVQTATRQAINNAQRVANSNKVHLNFDTSKQQLVNQIKILGRNNNKLFSDREMTAKYNQLLNSANVAKSTGELKTLRGELSAFKTELVATNNAGLTWGSKFKKSIESYAKFFSGASMIYALSNQVRNAATEAKTLDDSLVNLQKVTDEIGDRDALYKYFDKSLSKAQELNVKVGSLIDAVTEFKKLGWDLDDAELGAKWANILSNVGDVDIDTAIGSIKTSIASFDEIGGYGNDQMDKKLEAYTDLINNMSNKYSIDAEGLAESIRLSAGTLTEAHMSIEQAATMFATANKYYSDPSYLGNTAKIGSLRMRASSGDTDAIEELQEMGEEVDDLATATSNLREKLRALTGVDIMEDEHTFKSYYDQLYEISQVMDKLDDTSRANVLETMFGKSRSAAGAAILSGMKESASAYEDAINSAGSATEEYQTWMTSADAACQRFSNTLTETYQSIINGNTVRDLANLGSAVLEFANNWGIVEGTLKGVIALNLGKFIATGGMALITATKQVEQYGKALQMASNVPNGNLSARFQVLKSIAQATSTLTTEQLRNVLATNTLTQADRVRILQMQGMTKEMALQKLAEMNLTQATNAQTAANTTSTASTFSLKAAITGLGATLKSVFLSNPVGIVLMGISLGVSAVTSAVSKHNQAVEEARQKAKEAADAANTLGDEIATLANKYIQLSDAVKTDASAKEDLMTTQTELLKKLGLEGESIDDLIAKYGSLSNAIKQASIDSLKNQQTDLIAGVNAAKEELMDVAKDNFWGTNNIISASGEEAVKAFKELEKAGVIDSGSYGTGGGQLVLIGDDTVEGALENYKKLEDAVNALRDSEAFTADELSDNSLFNSIYSRYSEMKESVEAYNSSIDNLNENLAQQTMLTALQGNELPKTEEDFNKFKQELIDTAVASKQFIRNEKEITDAINNYLSTVPEFEGYYSIPLENELDKVDALLGQEDFSKTLDLTSQLTESDDKGASTATLADLKSEADLLSTIQKELSENGKVGVSSMQSIIKQFPEAKEVLSEYMAGIINEQELFAQLENVYNDDKTQYVNAVLEKVQADEEFFSSLKTGYPEVLAEIQNFVNQSNTLMEQAKENYINSIVAEEETCDKFLSFIKQTYPELYNELAEIYGNDKENFIRHIIAENETNKDFIDSLRTAYPDLANALATVYGNDVDNWTSMEQAKAQITANLINQLNAMWAEYFDGISETFGAFGSIMENADGSGYTFVGGQDDSHSYDHNLSDEENKSNAPAIGAYNNVKNKIQAAIKVANQAVSDLQGAAYDKIESSVGGLDWNDLGADSSSSSDSGSGSDSSDKDNSKDYDLIERKIKKLESAISALDTAVSDTYTSWGNRNSALVDELSSVSDEIALQQQAYQRYMDLANSVGLDGYYEDLIKNGEMDVITVDDENLQDQIDKFQDFYDKAQDCNDKIRDLNQNLKELQKTKFDNVVSQFEDISSSISHAVTMLDKYIDLADKHGYYASPELYQKQLEQYNNTLNTLTSERDTLQSKLQESVQGGLVEEGSEAWNDMLQQIQSVNEEIVDTVVNIQEVGNSLRDLNFTIFERGQDNISNLVNEGQFYVDLLDKMNKDLYDDDGKITNEGLTVQGIHSENYAAYLKQADFYAKEISAIEAELANDPANTTLIDKKQEYIEAQRESVLAAYDEKNAIIDLIKDGYDKASDALSKLIDKRKEALEAEKDLHDYQKSVQEKSDKVTELEKQKNAYVNDTSEEAKSKVQQLEVNLKEAQEDLAETEYDKYISDQEKLLDDLQTEYEDLINDRIDNIDKELGYVADAVNLNRDTIRSTLENLSQDTELPLTKAMRDVWNSATPVVDLNTTVQGIGSTVSGITLAINDIITRLNDLIAIMRGNLDSEINNYDDGSYNPNNSTPAPTPSYEPDPEPSYSYDESDDSDSGDDGNYDDLFVYKYYYPQPLDTEHSVVDRLKSNNIDASWDRRADYYEGIFGDDDYTGSDYQNIRMLDWLKEHGYAKGKKRGEYSTGYHLVGEEGNEFMITNGALREVGTEDTIFTADMAKNIADFSVDPTQYLSSHMPLPNVKPASIPNNVTSNVDTIEISLPNVTNYTEFKTQLMNDRGFKNYMSEATLGVALGHNELAVNKYK